MLLALNSKSALDLLWIPSLADTLSFPRNGDKENQKSKAREKNIHFFSLEFSTSIQVKVYKHFIFQNIIMIIIAED